MEVGPLPKLPLGAVVFPSPYDTISKFTDAKNVVLCDGVLYQVWRRPTGAGNATVAAPTGGDRRWIHIFKGDVFVLRFDPGNWPSSPCWSVVEAKDLRGNALFVGMNEAAVVRAEGVSANSVYYWDGPRGGDYEAVVYSLATEPPSGGQRRRPEASRAPCGTSCRPARPSVRNRKQLRSKPRLGKQLHPDLTRRSCIIVHIVSRKP